MATFLEAYKGAEIYEVGNVGPSEGETLGIKLLAKAKTAENLQVDFKEEAANHEEAVKKIKNKIDHYLDEHDLKTFE